MFCPDVNDTCQMLLNTFNDMLVLKNYANMCNSLQIGKPGDVDPVWLASVRNRVSMLSNSMSMFMSKYPDIFSGILYPFINYQSLFSSFAASRKQIVGKDQWLEALALLKNALGNAAAATTSANLLFQKQYQNVSNIQPLIDQSVQEGWNELASEEKEMVAIATALGALQQTVLDLSDDLTASDISDGQEYIQSTVEIAYDVIMDAEEASIPFLSFASILFTVGKSAYEVIQTSKEIQEDLNKIAELQDKATAEAQAAAGTKATLQVLYNLGKTFLSIQASLPRLAQMWKNEQQKIVDAINALNSGSEPNLVFDIQTMNIANATWTTLLNLVKVIQKPIATGKPVNIDTNTVKSN